MTGALTVAAPALAALQWQADLPPVLPPLTVALVCGWAFLLRRRLHRRTGARSAALLLAPKLLLAALLILALFDPVSKQWEDEAGQQRCLVLVDASLSMDVADRDDTSRLERAHRILKEIEAETGGDYVFETLAFDTSVRPAQFDGTFTVAPTRAPDERGTDLAGALATLREERDLSAYAAILLMTDGGDEMLDTAPAPGVPLEIVGIGAPPDTWTDTRIDALQSPDSVEKDAESEITVDFAATGDLDTGKLRAMRVSLVEMVDGAEQAVASKTVDLSRSRAQTTLTLDNSEMGVHRYRLRLEPIEPELTSLNNERDFSLNVRSRSVRVLYFTRQVGNAFKMVRAELARDPGIRFTGLFRTYSERFTVLGDRDDDAAERLSAGFPDDPAVLKNYDLIILGAFPAEDWSAAQQEALVNYVEEGGATIFLGGRDAYGPGGYAGSPLAALFPWHVSPSDEFVTGTFVTRTPAAARFDPILSGAASRLQTLQPAIESYNQTGRLKLGATLLLETFGDSGNVPLAARHTVGEGEVLAFATNTLWRWGRKSGELREAYGLLWRQAARTLAEDAEEGRRIRVRWSKERYQPGDTAHVEIELPPEIDPARTSVSANLVRADELKPIDFETDLATPRIYRADLVLASRGDYEFRAVAYEGDELIETYETALAVRPRVNEGAHLAVDHHRLSGLAGRGDGHYYRESDWRQLLENWKQKPQRRTFLVESSLLRGSLPALLVLIFILLVEWTLRRRHGLF